MKKIISIGILAILVMAGCKKDNNNPAPGNGNNNVNPQSDVNDVKLNITSISTQVMPLNVGTYYAVFEMVNGSIYFGNVSNAGVTPYFSRYNIATNTFTTGLDTSAELCACGYGSKMISDGKDIYYIANEAEKFSVADNKWIAINFPATAQNNHGESAPVYLDKKIYYFGGRTPSNVAKYYDITKNSWFNVADFLYPTTSAAGIAANGNIYVMGGENGANRLSMYSPAANVWVAKANLPFDGKYFQVRGHKLAVLDKYIFVNVMDSIHVYDMQADKWSANPMELPFTPDVQNVNLFSWNNTMYITNRNGAGAFQLYQAKLN